MGDTTIPGASVWEQQIYDHVVRHMEDEVEVIRSYERLAEQTDSPAFAYLARMILDDERRHHRLLLDLAETIKAAAQLSGEPTPIPDLGMWGADREQILAETERYLELEREDNKELKRLAKELRDVKDTTIWELVIRIIQRDNEKHQQILEFIRDRARERR
jgi:rubrerythrin